MKKDNLKPKNANRTKVLLGEVKSKKSVGKKKKFKEYQITTIEDFMNVVTEKNVDMMTGNFYGMAFQWLKIKKAYPKMKFKSFKWIDDGLIEIRKPEVFQMNVEDNGA